MRIWLQNFVPIQPRTSREKSDVSWPRDVSSCAGEDLHEFDDVLREVRGRPTHGPEVEASDPGAQEAGVTTHHSFLSSFSAVSKRNFANKYAFFQVFRDL